MPNTQNHMTKELEQQAREFATKPARETELLNCPFCGGKAAWAEGDQKSIYGNEQIYCTECFAVTPPEPSKQEAAVWWNARVAASAADRAVERIKVAVEGLRVADNWQMEQRNDVLMEVLAEIAKEQQ